MNNVRPLPNLCGVIQDEKIIVKEAINKVRLDSGWDLTSKTMDAMFPVFHRANLLIQIANHFDESY